MRVVLSFKIIYNVSCPDQLVDYLILRSRMYDRNLRDETLLSFQGQNEKTGQTTFQYSAAADWNSFPKCIRDITSLKRFRTELYGYFRDLDVKSNHCSLT